MQRELACRFAARLGPAGPWRSTASSLDAWHKLRVFALFLAALERPVTRLAELTPAVWSAWRLSRPANVSGRYHLVKVAALLVDEPSLPEATRALLRRRGPERPKPTEHAYDEDTFARITAAAARLFRAAHARIRRNLVLLERWRLGQFDTDSEEAMLGAILDVLARTGDVPYYRRADGVRRLRHRHQQVLAATGEGRHWQRPFLDGVEAVSLTVPLVARHGWNPTSVLELPVPTGPDSGAGGPRVWRLELEKRRRDPRHRCETRNLTDWGPSSPGHLITQAMEATAPARDLLAGPGRASDRLLFWHKAIPLGHPDPAAMFHTGQLEHHDLDRWAQTSGIAVSLRRLRKTAVAQHRRIPIPHTQDTHDATYVLPDPQTAGRAAGVITAGIDDAIAHARSAFTARRGTGDEAGAETVTARCTDHHHSPLSPQGAPCTASFLLCLACPNAIVAPEHLPRLAYLHRALGDLRAVLDGPVWDRHWRTHFDRLEDLRQRHCSTAEWTDALGQARQGDRDLIDRLLHRGFDT